MARLQESIAAAVREQPVQDIFDKNGVVAVGSTPAEFADVIRRDLAKYTEVQKLTGGK